MTTTQDVLCPKCNGRTWDNRSTKRNPRAPDYKCRDTGCDGAVWPPKNGNGQAPAPTTNGRQPHSIGGPQPYDEQPYSQAQPQRPAPQPAVVQMQAMYEDCLTFCAATVPTRVPGATPADIIAATATVFIQRAKAGV